MKTYEQVLETVELALIKGEYQFCIEFLSPIIKSYPLLNKEGVHLRTILITALCAVNKKEEAKKLCQELLKSYDYKTRENAKYFLEIIDSPEIKKPENWNIKIESNTSLNKKSLNSLKQRKGNKDEKKFINITNTPTGETKPFQKGFAVIIFLILLILIPLLSGCVKIENTLDLSQIDSINNYLEVESKYINKFPWQIKFEEEMKDIFPDAEILLERTNFSMKNKNLNIGKAKEILRRIQQIAGEIADESTDLNIKTTEKNYVFLKKYNYKIDFDLQSLSNIKDLEINFKIIHPSKVSIVSESKSQLETSRKEIVWHLIPGQINNIEFSFLSWDKLSVGITLIVLLIAIAYSLRFYRFKLGTDLPQLPAD